MLKYTVKLIAWKHNPNPLGLLPIYIKITIHRQTTYISTGHYVAAKMFDEKNQVVRAGHPMAGVINPDLTSRKNEVIKKIVEAQLAGRILTAAQVKGLFQYKKDLHNIFDFADDFAEQVKNKRTGSTLENYRKHLLKLELFHGSRSLHFEDITQDFLQRYENHLRLTVGSNYTHALFKTLKTFFNAARKHGLINHYPFDQYENPVYQAPQKDYLTYQELQRWEKYSLTVRDPIVHQAAIYFLLGCYTGLRISDWFTFDVDRHLEDGRMKLRAKKNGEWVTMPVSSPLKRLIGQIKKTRLQIEEPTINEKLKVIATALQIPKRITSHSGRHTFAITVCADRGISSETCAQLMGITVKTCVENYYRVTNRKIDAETLKAWKGL